MQVCEVYVVFMWLCLGLIVHNVFCFYMFRTVFDVKYRQCLEHWHGFQHEIAAAPAAPIVSFSLHFNLLSLKLASLSEP